MASRTAHLVRHGCNLGDSYVKTGHIPGTNKCAGVAYYLPPPPPFGGKFRPAIHPPARRVPLPVPFIPLHNSNFIARPVRERGVEFFNLNLWPIFFINFHNFDMWAWAQLSSATRRQQNLGVGITRPQQLWRGGKEKSGTPVIERC